VTNSWGEQVLREKILGLGYRAVRPHSGVTFVTLIVVALLLSGAFWMGSAVSAEGALPVASWGTGVAGDGVEFERVSPEQGLSQSSVHCILQDQQGFMWFGTSDGLNKYDGYSFTVYKYDPEDRYSLSDNMVRAIYEDREGVLWVGTRDGGLDRFERETGRFIRYQYNANEPTTLGSNYVFSIHEDHWGTLWIGTNGGGLNRFDPETERFTRHQHRISDAASLTSDRVLSVYEDRAGVLWVGTNNGLDRFDRETETFVHFQNDPDDPHSLSSKIVLAIYEGRAGELWIGTGGGGLNRLDRETMALLTFARGEGVAGQVMVAGEAAIVEDVLADPHQKRERPGAHQVVLAEGICSFMHLPIKVDDDVFGVFNVNFVTPHAFGAGEIRLFTALAQRAALAIQNAQVYERAQELAVMEERNRLARDLHDAVTQTLFSASLIAQALPVIWDNDREEGHQLLTEMQRLSRGALAEMRTLLLELRPTALEEMRRQCLVEHCLLAFPNHVV